MLPPRLSMRALTRVGFVFVLPLLAVLSTFWSQYPALSLRYSVQMMATYAIATVVLNKISSLTFMKILFLAFAFAAVVSIALGRARFDGVSIGIFNSKNAYAATLAAGLLCSCAVIICRKIGNPWRIAGIAIAFICFTGMLRAQSAGTILTVFPSIVLCMALSSLAVLAPRQRGSVLFILALVAVYFAVNFYMFGDYIFSSVLNAVGKDATLTGRTVLWSVANNYIDRNPLLGLGYKAFWVQGFAPAEMLWAEFLIASKSGFNFHNTYYEFSVQLGLIGGFVAFALLTGGLLIAIYANFVQPSVPQALIAALMTFLYLKSFGEVGILFEFNSWTVVLLASWIFSFRTIDAARSARQRFHRRPVGAVEAR